MRWVARDIRRRDGMTLIEVLAYLAIATVLINLAGTLFLSGVRLNAVAVAATERAQVIDALCQDFTREVSGGIAVRNAFQSYTTGPNSLVLETAPPPDDAAARRFVVFGPGADPEHLTMLVAVQNGAQFVVDRYTTYDLPLKEFVFSYGADPAAAARLVTLTMMVAPYKEGRPAQAFGCTAALRGRDNG